MTDYFNDIEKIKYQGTDAKDELAFRHYDADKVVLGKSMKEHLRFAACYWHSFCWPGGDAFGGQTLMRPWFEPGDEMQQAEMKMDVAFEFFDIYASAA